MWCFSNKFCWSDPRCHIWFSQLWALFPRLRFLRTTIRSCEYQDRKILARDTSVVKFLRSWQNLKLFEEFEVGFCISCNELEHYFVIISLQICGITTVGNDRLLLNVTRASWSVEKTRWSNKMTANDNIHLFPFNADCGSLNLHRLEAAACLNSHI